MNERRLIARFRNDRNGSEVLFAAPRRLIVAWSPDEFDRALQEIELVRGEGGWLAGYLSYEAGYLLDPALVDALPEGRRAPLLCFGVFDEPADMSLDHMDHQQAGSIAGQHPGWTQSEYERCFSRLHQHLREGDCYQANLTFPFRARWHGDPLALFDALRERQPVRYSAFVDLDGPVVLSRSPELFFKVGRDRWIETLPMKGTAPRGLTPTDDLARLEGLRHDPKNQAENRMIVDLLRNDISRISEVGTLEVPELFRIETYPTVHQMVSHVRARLRPEIGLPEIMAALFPCGSITGAPKMWAMRILHELEDRPRDAYCGAIGWCDPKGPMQFSVAIRTLTLFNGGDAVFNVGGGIVFDSTAEAEYQECLLKAQFAVGNQAISR